MSQELAKLGHKVIVFNDAPKGSVHSLPNANPCFTDVIPNYFDIAIVWRNVQCIKCVVGRAKKTYFWPHDICSTKISEEDVAPLDGILWLSEWQRKQWLSLNPNLAQFTEIFGNGICPSQFSPVETRSNPYSCIYASNYARGLSYLLDCWPKIKESYPKAVLNIYYGWKSWGNLSQLEGNKLQEKIKFLDVLDVREHGLVGHQELAQAFSTASFWTYPCSQVETFCITALKAQLGGAIPVIVEESALSETVRSGFKCHNPSNYGPLLEHALSKAETISLEERQKMGEFILNQFTWEHIASKWNEFFFKGNHSM
jgi:glycosyltransferase involved in cell wall biosynthesis